MKLVIRNRQGLIIACLYITNDGTLHKDSWLCAKGWKAKT